MDYLIMFLILVVIDYIYFKLRYSRPNGPPAWYGLPFVGFLPLFILPRPVFRRAYKIFLEKMPNIFITRVLSPSIIVKDPYIMEVQKNDSCTDRSTFAITDFTGLVLGGKPGWLFFDGGDKSLDWRGNRRTNLQALYVLPKGHKFSRIAESVNIFLKVCEERGHKFRSYRNDLMFSMFQTACNMNLGRVFDSNHVKGFLDGLLAFNEASTFFFAVVMFVPVPVLKFAERHFNTSLKPMMFNRIYKEFWRRVVLSTERNNPEPTNYVEAVLRAKNMDDADLYIRRNIFFTIVAETITMVHSTATTLTHLALNPHFQQKVSEELISVVGKEDLSLDHLDRLHYLKAACNEALRISAPVVGIARQTSENTKLGEYEVPPGMSTILCFHSETFNPKYFPQPYTYNPERFINKEGHFEENPNMAVFSRGRRGCPGQEIAKMMLHIYTAKILQQFELVPKDVNVKLNTEFTGGVLPGIPEVPLKFLPRSTAPPISEFVLQTGLTEILNQVVNDDKQGKLFSDF